MKPTCVWWDVHHASMRSSAACSWRITYSTPPWGSERRRPAYVERGEMIVRDNARQLKNRVCIWLQARHLAVHPYQHRRVAPVVLCALLLYVVYASLLTPSGWGRWGIPRCRLTHCLGVSCVSSPSSPLLSLNSLARPPTTPIQPRTHTLPATPQPTYTHKPTHTRLSPHPAHNTQFPIPQMPKADVGRRARAPKRAKKGHSPSFPASANHADPDAPKRGLSAYMFFANDQRQTVRDENPGIAFGMRAGNGRNGLIGRPGRQGAGRALEGAHRRRQEEV